MTLESCRQTGKALFEKLKADKRAVLLLCAAFALLAIGAGLRVHTTEKETAAQEHTLSPPTAQSDEARLCALLSSVRGAGRVQVMITYSEREQTVYAAERQSDTQSGANGEVRKKQSENPVILKGADAQTGLVERTLAPKVQGVAVVCAGAGNPAVKAQIVAAVSALFSLNSNHISVAELANQEEPT